jgi:protein phosphatase
MTHWFLKLSHENEDDFKRELESSLQVIQESIFGSNEPVRRQMGTTVTMAYIVWPRMYVVHAGDSRCYLLRDGELSQLTTDHTFAQRLLDEKAITPAQAATSRWRHVLWNCVGGGDNRVTTEVTKTMLKPSDAILLCSDGLTGMVSDAEIQTIMTSARSSRDAVDRLISAANDAGGVDNISVVVARYADEKLPT